VTVDVYFAVSLVAIVIGGWTLLALALTAVISRAARQPAAPQPDSEWLDAWDLDDPREHVLAMPYGEVLRACDEIADFNRLDTYL
jgi:hypothetical protein